MTDDSRLLQQYAEHGSQAAFTELVRRHLGLVYHAALRQLDGDSATAGDIAQGVFILLASQARLVRRHPALIGWLYQTTHFKVAEALRQQRRRKAREMEATAREERDRTDTRWDELRPELDSAIMRLGDKDRAALILRYFEGSTVPDIAATLGLSEDAVQKRLERSLEKLRRILSGRQIGSTAAAISAVLATQTGLAAPVGFDVAVAGLALGTAAGAVSGAGLALFLMTKFQAIVGCTLLAALVGVGYVDHMSQRTQILEGRDTIAALRKSLAASAAAEKSDQAQITQLRQRPSVMAAQPRRGDVQAANSRTGAGNNLSMDDVLKEHPEMRPVFNRLQRSNIALVYGSALTSLGLPADKLRQLVGLLADLKSSQGDARDAALSAGLQEGTSAFGNAIRQAQDADRLQIVALVGDQGWAQLQQAPLTYSYQNEVNSTLASSFQASGVPLSNDQSQALVQAINDIRNQRVNAAARDPGFRQVDPQTELSPSDQALIGRASQVLSAEQTAVLKQQFSDENQIHAAAGTARIMIR